MRECPRCQNEFTCKSENIAQCECSKLHLSAQTLDFLSKTSWSCLCNNCLKHFNSQIAESLLQPFPKGNHDFIEKVHYNMEGGLLVFSELFLIQRGYCCQSACRNCPYGFRKE